MKALTFIEHSKFALLDKPKSEILDPRDAVVRVTLGSICTSDLHVKHGYRIFENKLDGIIKIAIEP